MWGCGDHREQNRIKSLPLGGLDSGSEKKTIKKISTFIIMQLEEDGHTAGAQLVLVINSKLPLSHSIHILVFGLVCGLMICIIIAATTGLSGNQGGVAVWGQMVCSRYPWGVLLRLGSGDQAQGVGEGPR